MFKLFPIVIGVFLLMSGLAISDIIDGKVIDQNGIPIEGVNVQTNISSVSSVTDSNGKFVLDYKDELPSYLTFSHVSYQPVMLKMTDYKKGLEVIMTLAVYPGQKIRVTAMRAETGLTPVAFSDITDEDIERDYTVADFPMLLESTPNMYAYSFTGGLTGASDYKIRGFDSKRIGVYINGVPLNDPEDRFTYFYDLADFAAEVADIQVQRGVGNSLYGDATFGGSINIASAGLDRQRKVSLSTGYGQYFYNGNHISDVRKQAFEYSTGLIDGRWSFAGRYSKLYSGGYRKGSWYDGWAYFLSISRVDPNMTTTINIYGGPMKAHLAFDGISREQQNANRIWNPATYENEIDDFNQPHYELHNAYKISNHLTLNNSLYYIRGKGYYEQYKSDRDIYEYNIPTYALIDPAMDEIDLILQKWVTKNQYGWNPRLEWDHTDGTAIFGGAFYYFNSRHWGQVIWAENVNDTLNNPHRYYEYFGKKYSASVYALEYYSIAENIRLMGNVQLRYLKYDFDQVKLGALPGHDYSIDWLFLSPRAGITYLINDNSNIHFSFGVSSREPADVTIYDAEDVAAFPQLEIDRTIVDGTDTSYVFGDPLGKSERLFDFELGGSYRADKYKLGLNLFWMEFKNEIIPNGALDDNGQPLLGNADRSVHAGIEIDGAVNPMEHLRLSGNFSYNHNRFKDYVAYNDIYYDGSVIDTVDYSGHPVPGFPEYIGNLIADFKYHPIQLVYRLRMVGKQYVENNKNDSLAIGDYMVSSLSASVAIGKLAGQGNLTLSGRIDNLFNAKYEQSGYAYIWWGEDWAGEYYPAAERNFYVQLKWELY